MSLLRRLLIGGSTDPELTERTLPPAPAVPPLPIDWLGSPFDPQPIDREATAISAVYGAAQLITSTASRLPLHAYAGDERLDRQPDLIRKPDPFRPRLFWLSDVFTSLVFRGNAYLRLTAPNPAGTPTVALAVNPDEVHVTWNENRTRPVYEWRGQRMTPGVDWAHIPLFMVPGELLGLSPLQAARRVVNGARQMDEYRRRLFSDGAIPSLTLETEEELDPEESDAARERWIAQHLGRRGPSVLSGGMQANVLGISPEEAQFLESAQFQVTDIARFFGVPSALLEAPPQGGANSIVYQNLATLFDAFLRQGLVNYLERVEASLTELLPNGAEVRFDTRAILRTDIKTRYDAYAVGLTNGFLTVEEVRAAENLGPMEETTTPTSGAPSGPAATVPAAPGVRGPNTAQTEPSTLAAPSGSRFPNPSGGMNDE